MESECVIHRPYWLILSKTDPLLSLFSVRYPAKLNIYNPILNQEIFEPVQYDEIIEITPQIHVRFNDAGHMLGSSIIEVWVEENGKKTKTVFSGDIGNNDIK